MDLDPAVSYLRLAERDMDDIFNSHMFVIFTVDPHEFIKRGGKHFEAGYAYALGIRICVVGPNENIFYSLPEMQHFRDWNDFICREPEWAN
jgi:nucleoside 2-deoxyribosyltransferase